MYFFRLLRIFITATRYGLDEFFLGHERVKLIRWAVEALFFWRTLIWPMRQPRGERLRLALESLGPIFVKFGQMLSTRRDMVPPDIADELAKLQDRVPPFPSDQALAVIKRAYGRDASDVFAEFENVPVASASVAQVHRARLKSGEKVAVKVLRPGIQKVIGHDVQILDLIASLIDTDAHHFAQLVAGFLDCGFGGGGEATAGIVDGFFEHGCKSPQRFLNADSSPERSLRMLL